MDYKPVAFIVGTLLLAVAAIPAVPVIFIMLADGPGNTNLYAFLTTSGLAALVGLPLAAGFRKSNLRLTPRQMYMLTVAVWLAINAFCAIPFVLSTLHMSVVDAVFETVSGTTTTGATVLTGLDTLPRELLIWRALLQWLGGIGIIVMVIAILPHLRVGGMRLFRSEASDKSEKITSRSRKVARNIGIVYVILTVMCLLAYWAGGMDLFNAVLHALTTVSTGGFSTSDLSMRQFADGDVIWISTLFMFLSGLPFVLLTQTMHGNYQVLFRDQQVRGYAALIVISVVTLTIWLIAIYGVDVLSALQIACFHVVSIVTTTGYASIDYNLWGGFAAALFFFLTFVGACAGSTGGGIKIFRFQIAAMMLRNQIQSMVHPRGIFPAYYNSRAISEDIVTSVIAFAFIFAATIAFITLGLGLTGLDLTTSLSGAASAVANVGPGLGDIIGPSGTYQSLTDFAKWLLIIAMLLGRLEILTVLVIFSAQFWRG